VLYGTKWSGISPGKGSTRHFDLPVFDTVAESVRKDRRRCQRDLCAAAGAADAICEAIDAESR